LENRQILPDLISNPILCLQHNLLAGIYTIKKNGWNIHKNSLILLHSENALKKCEPFCCRSMTKLSSVKLVQMSFTMDMCHFSFC
jgi:hypothetical protein